MTSHDIKIGYLNLSPISVLYERVARPELAGKPFVVVGSIGNRGLVTAVSPEAMAAGIRPAITPDTARAFVPDIRIVEERPAVYYDAAREVHEVCERFVPAVDAEKQDAFVLDLTGTDRLYPDPSRLIISLQSTISRDVHIASRAGLGASRLIARLASVRAGELGVFSVEPGQEDSFLADYPVTVLPGVGTKIAQRLRWLGVRTVRELGLVPKQTLEAAFGPKGLDIARAAHGHDPRPRRKPLEHKPLMRLASLEQLFYDPKMVRAELGKLVAGLGLDLRAAGMRARSVALEIRYPDTPPVSGGKRIPPTDMDSKLLGIVEEMWCATAVRRVRLRGMSLTYGRLIPRDDQMRLEFARDAEVERARELERAMDRLRRKYGLETIGPGTWWSHLRRRTG